MNESVDKVSNIKLITRMNAFIVVLMVSGVKGIANYLSFALMIGIFILWGTSRKGVISYTQQMLCVFIYMLYYALTSLFNLNLSYFFTYFSYYLLSFSPILICYLLIINDNYNLIKKTLIFIICVWDLMAIYCIGMYLTNPMAARESAADTGLYTGSLFGGYFFAYGSSLLCVYLLYYFREPKFKKYKLLILANVAVLGLVVFLTNSTLTTFATIIGAVAVFFLDGKEYYSVTEKRRMKLIAFIFIIGLLYLFINHYLDQIYSFVCSRTEILFYKRIKEVIDAFFFSTESNHYAKRTGTLNASIEMFFQNPIFGVGYKYGNVFSVGKAYGMGNHSEIIDTIGRYGIVGGVPVLLTYYYGVKDFFKNRIGVIVTLVFLMMFNPFRSYQSHMILFLVIPLLDKYVQQLYDNE